MTLNDTKHPANVGVMLEVYGDGFRGDPQRTAKFPKISFAVSGKLADAVDNKLFSPSFNASMLNAFKFARKSERKRKHFSEILSIDEMYRNSCTEENVLPFSPCDVISDNNFRREIAKESDFKRQVCANYISMSI